MRTFAVAKAQGTGNDFILLDNAESERLPFATLAQRWCDRRFGIGADGLLVLEPPADHDADIALTIFNADGSEAEMCGNGIRCVARFLHQTRPDAPANLTVQTASGPVRTRLINGNGSSLVAVDMGVPRFARSDIPMRGDADARALDEPIDVAGGSLRVSALSMGNPHCVSFIETPLDHVDLAAHAAALASLDLFPNGANYELARVTAGVLSMRVFERGVGETQACGSGACAAGVAAIITGRATSPVDVHTRGGQVRVEWAGPGASVTLTGPAEIVFFAEIAVPDDVLAATQSPAAAE
jgi:diaminopimelate epimerase